MVFGWERFFMTRISCLLQGDHFCSKQAHEQTFPLVQQHLTYGIGILSDIDQWCNGSQLCALGVNRAYKDFCENMISKSESVNIHVVYIIS
jgi:hypothetical protein